MDFLAESIIPYVLIYKYTALFVVSFLAAFIVPIPSGSVLMATAAFASIGYFDISLVIIISIIGNILGDNLSYWISYRYGKKIISSIGFHYILQSNKFKTVERRFRERPGFIIFASRFEVLSTLFVNFLSGLGRVNYSNYLKHEVFGTISQVLLYAALGYIFGYNIQLITSITGEVFSVIAITLILLFIFYKKKIFN